MGCPARPLRSGSRGVVVTLSERPPLERAPFCRSDRWASSLARPASVWSAASSGQRVARLGPTVVCRCDGHGGLVRVSPGAARVSWLPPSGVGLPQASQRRRASFPVEATSAGRHWGRQGSRRSRVAPRRSDAERWLGRGGGRRATNGSYELEFGANGGSCCPALLNRPRRGCEASSRPEGIFGEGRTVIACSGRSRRGGCASPALPWPML